VIELEQNLLLARKEVALKVLRLSNLVHYLNDVTIRVELVFCPFENLLNVDHVIVVEASATQELEDRT
jgi:hypothetical protein